MVDWRGNAAISGKLAEDFVKERWGLKEDENYEVKSTSRKNNQVVLKTIQLIQSGRKMFVIVRYDRKTRALTKGPRKGRKVAAETVAKAFEHKLDVFTIRGFDLLKIISREKRPLLITKIENDAEWAFYWIVKIRSLSSTVLYEDDRVRVMGDILDPPSFLEPVPF